jgi:hypothetical protein
VMPSDIHASPAAAAPPAPVASPAPAVAPTGGVPDDTGVLAGPLPSSAGGTFPTVTISPVGPITGVASPPAATPGPLPVVPGRGTTPPATARARAGGGAGSGGLSRRERWLLAMIVLDLGVVASWQGWPGTGRGRLTLYDDVVPGPAPVLRVGRAPSLR